jgi:hypothetical protein
MGKQQKITELKCSVVSVSKPTRKERVVVTLEVNCTLSEYGAGAICSKFERNGGVLNTSKFKSNESVGTGQLTVEVDVRNALRSRDTSSSVLEVVRKILTRVNTQISGLTPEQVRMFAHFSVSDQLLPEQTPEKRTVRARAMGLL